MAIDQALVPVMHLNNLMIRAAKQTCHVDSHTGKTVCVPHESFFHRVGRWIMAGCLIFFGLLALLALLIFCFCIKRHRSKAKKAKAQANGAYPTQAYEAPPPPPPPPPHPPAAHVDSKDGQITGTTGVPHNPQNGAAASYYNGNYH